MQSLFNFGNPSIKKSYLDFNKGRKMIDDIKTHQKNCTHCKTQGCEFCQENLNLCKICANSFADILKQLPFNTKTMLVFSNVIHYMGISYFLMGDSLNAAVLWKRSSEITRSLYQKTHQININLYNRVRELEKKQREISKQEL